MRRIKSSVSVVVLVAGVALALPPAAGAARMPAIHGDLRCAVNASQMHFDPALMLVANNSSPSKSRTTFTAVMTGCRGATPTSPAPGGISYGFLELKGHLKKNSCVDLAAEGPGTMGVFYPGPQRLKLTWYDGSGVRVGRNSYGADQKGLELVYDDFWGDHQLNPIATIPLASTLRPSAKAFGGEPAATNIPIDLTAFSDRCASGPVAGIPLLGGEVTIGNPS